MASMSTSSDPSSTPLADYFFISGIESSRIFDSNNNSNGFPTSPRRESIIKEDTTSDSGSVRRVPQSPPETSRQRARFSYENRKSTGSIGSPEIKEPSSNRSSATIKAVQENGTAQNATGDPFEQAMKKFAADRDSMTAELQFSAGQLAQPSKPAPKPRPKTQRIEKEEAPQIGRSPMGTVRRRLSTMNPLSRQPTARRTSARMSKRVSGYNSVMPAPQRFAPDPSMYPLKRPYEPVLLDQYPPKDSTSESKKRAPFPEYVPMFVFPNDINIVASDEKPKATWHGFTQTNGGGVKMYAICLIVWIPLNQDVAAELERQCDQWRRLHMSEEERDFANSLGERLVNERAHLSDLLAELPEIPHDTPEREAKDEEISAVEEKISLMTDMLKPVRHGAASKIEGLTDSETGLWMPRAYGVMGRDPAMTRFWKEWLRAIAIPIMNGTVLRVPPSSPRVGMWQPIERYVVNLCTEAPSPITSITQIELSVRELRMYSRKEAINEIPGSRNTDLYPLFKALDIPHIIHLFEFALMESRIILLSSYTSMLHLTSAAIVQLLYPFQWQGIFIPVLPARLIQALEAPCPYIVGIERRYENVQLPEDDFVLVDLDTGVLEATNPPTMLPRQQRRKLMSTLQLAAPHRYKFGVPQGTPRYAMEAFPSDTFCSENSGVFTHIASPSTLPRLAGLNSDQFGRSSALPSPRSPVFNAFSSSRNGHSRGSDRPSTSSTSSASGTPPSGSPLSTVAPSGTFARNESGTSLQASLREKRSGLFDSARRSSSVIIRPTRNSSTESIPNKAQILDRKSTVRRPSIPFVGHQTHGSNASISGLKNEWNASSSNIAPSTYAQSTIAPSTIMPNMLMQPVHNSDTTQWVEGHCMEWKVLDREVTCSICDELMEDDAFKCSGKLLLVYFQVR